MKKVSFSLSSSSSSSKPSNPSQNQPPNKQFITEFDPSKTLPNPNPNPNPNPIIIPPIPNQWNPNSTSNSITYGLNLRTKKVTTSDNSDKNSKAEAESESMSAIDRLMLMKLKSDLKRLPDDKGLDEFNDVSVNEFAAAYLKGYGWVEGRGIGKNAKDDVKVVEFSSRRSGRQGLGFVTTDSGDH